MSATHASYMAMEVSCGLDSYGQASSLPLLQYNARKKPSGVGPRPNIVAIDRIDMHDEEETRNAQADLSASGLFVPHLQHHDPGRI